jgi:hypothetical protein
MAVIKSGFSTDQLKVDTLSNAARVTLYNTAGNEVSSLPISGSVSVSNLPATQAISAASLPLPSGAATATKQSDGSQKSQLVDGAGDIADVKLLSDSITATDKGLVVQSAIHGLSSGGGGSYVELKVTPSGAAVVDGSGVTQPVSGSVSVSNFPATQPISAASLPLPSGAATSANQTTANSSLSSIDSKTPALVSGRQPVDGSGVTQPISAASLPLPSGASTEATLALIKAKTDNLDVLLSTRTKPADSQHVTVDNPTSSVSVSNFPATQNVAVTSSVAVVARTTDEQTLQGVYYYHGGANLVQAAADAATAGRFWIINPVGSTVTVRVKSIEFASQLGSALAAPTSPRLTIERVSFTGTASGASLAPAKRKTSDASPQSSLRTASTGLTLTAGNPVVSFLPVASATAVGYTNTAVEKWRPDVNDRIELVAGEGIVCRQADAGTTSDTRRFTLDITVEEF